MLTYRLNILSGAFMGALILAPVAKGSSFSSTDSKHGYHHAKGYFYWDYAKFEWLSSDADSSTATVNRILVSLADQRLYAYHDQHLLAWSNISSGGPGHETPTGIFSVSEKDPDHHSSLYDNASMPFFMRLTDNGLGLHAGFLPGYPASHGCVRMPLGMARELYQHVESGTPVEITPNSINHSLEAAKPTVVELSQL